MSAATYTSPITGLDAPPPSKLYEMSSTANSDLPLSRSSQESDDDNTPASGASCRDALLQHPISDDFNLAQKLQDEYHDEDRSMEFVEREKEEMRMRERAEAERQREATMWWAKRATFGVALYAVGSVVVLRVLPAWFGSEEGSS